MWNRHIHTGTQNVHNVHNAHIDNRNPETQKHLRLLSSGTKLFITFEFKGFSTWGRERHNLSMTTFPSAPNHVRHPPQGLDELRKSTGFFRSRNSTNKLFSNLRPRFRCLTSLISLGFLLWHLWMTRPLRARVNTCAHVCT